MLVSRVNSRKQWLFFSIYQKIDKMLKCALHDNIVRGKKQIMNILWGDFFDWFTLAQCLDY